MTDKTRMRRSVRLWNAQVRRVKMRGHREAGRRKLPPVAPEDMIVWPILCGPGREFWGFSAVVAGYGPVRDFHRPIPGRPSSSRA